MGARVTSVGALCLALLLALGFVPGFAGPSYAFSLTAGLLMGPAAALMAATLVYRRKPFPGRAAKWGLGVGLGLAGGAFLVSIVHGFRIGFCDPAQDYLRFALGPATGALCGGLWGAVVGTLLPRGRGMAWVAVVLALLLPLTSYLASGIRFYTSPMVFAFDHFVGYFAGTLYDTELGSLERLWTYRLGTLGFLVAGVSGLAVLRRNGERLEISASVKSSSLWVGVPGLALGLAITVNGEQLGHYQTTASIIAALGNRASATRCEVVYSNAVPKQEAHLLARECDAHVAELERYFEAKAPATIRVFLFESAAQKAALMGARHVYVAKPWRGEIYLQPNGFPHPVLGHELAHVVAGAFAPGPFSVAGKWGGLVPDPGRIEGVAVAASPSESDPLSLRQWAAAMQRLQLLPSLADIFQLGFFGSNSATAYTVAGAFIEWLRETHGVSAVKAWYTGATLKESTGKSLQELEQAFLVALGEVSLTQKELGVARARFDRPAVLKRRCVHQVDAALSRSHELVARGDPAAQQLLREVLVMDPSALQAELQLGRYYQLDGQLRAAEATYRKLSQNEQASAVLRATAHEHAGDAAWLQGEFETASSEYGRAQALLVDEDRLRTLDVKQLAVSSKDERERRAVRVLFFGHNALYNRPHPVLTGETLGRWAEATGAPLASYLLAKQYLAAAEWELAGRAFRRAIEGGLELRRVRHEALRGLLVSACALGASDTVRATWLSISREQSTLSDTRRTALGRFAKRCGVDAGL